MGSFLNKTYVSLREARNKQKQRQLTVTIQVERTLHTMPTCVFAFYTFHHHHHQFIVVIVVVVSVVIFFSCKYKIIVVNDYACKSMRIYVTHFDEKN